MHPRAVERAETEEVVIGEQVIPGWIDDVPCEQCGANRIYHEQFDAFFCSECNRWLEGRCGDATCAFCRERPDSPVLGDVPDDAARRS